MMLPEALLPLMPLVVVLIGLCFGSYVTMASYRMPLEKDTIFKPSFCPSCNHKLGFVDLFPLFTWLATHGTCRYCKTHVPVRYPIIELSTALIFLLLYQYKGFTIDTLILWGLALGIIIMIVTDLEHYIIPDQIQIWLALLALVNAWVHGLDFEPLAIGAAAGFVFGYILCVGYPMLRGIEGLGFGDVKFFLVAGLWLGWLNLIPFFVLSGVLGVGLALVWRALGRGKYFPFGPALGITLFLFVAYPALPEFFWTELHARLLGLVSSIV